MVQVAIIGAGLGGLALAQGLARQGIGFTVYERDAAPDSRTQGYRIRIDETGQQALARCLSPAHLALFRETCAVSSSGGRFLTPRLEPAAGAGVETWRPSAQNADDADAPGDLSAHRLTLREVLLCGIEDRVRFGQAFADYAVDESGQIIARFEDGDHVLADVVVAADGVGSAVRRQRLPRRAPTETGALCIYGRTPRGRETDRGIAPVLLGGTSVVFADACAVIIDAMSFRQSPRDCARRYAPDWHLSPVDDYLYWAFIGPGDRFGIAPDTLPALDGAGLLARIGTWTQDWHPGLRALFHAADPAAPAALPIRTAAPLTPWSPSRVTLLGDAVHVMSPAGGLGANTALADAAMLADALGAVARRQTPLAEAIAAYEDDMRRRATAAVQASLAGAGRLFAHRDPAAAE